MKRWGLVMGSLCMSVGSLSDPAGDARQALQMPLSSMPFSIQSHPSETAYNNPATLLGAQGRETLGGRFMAESLASRPYFRLNPQTDPLITLSQHIHQNHQAMVGGRAFSFEMPVTDTIVLCLEGKPTLEMTCTESLQTGVVTQRKKTYLYTRHHGWLRHCLGFDYTVTSTPNEYNRVVESGYDGCNYWNYTITQYNKFEVRGHTFHMDTGHREDHGWQEVDEATYNKVSLEKDQQKDRWVSSCPELEARVRTGRCYRKEDRCISPNQAKLMEGVEPLTITRPCWQREVTYVCTGSSKQECDPLRNKGCIQVNSKCHKTLSSECIEWEQKMRCPTLQGVKKSVTLPSSIHGSSWKVEKELPHVKNTDFAEVMAKLSLFREMQKDTGAHTISVFKGTTNRCTKAFAGFKDCCGKQSGWGITFNLSGCNGEDQALAQKRAKNLCVEVGEYCAEREKITKICLRKKKSFCCFESKLSRIFHEQGRRQLGLGWGEPKDPQCRGLTVEELQRMDFDRIDLSELAQDILSQVKVPDVGATTQQLKDRLTAMTHSVTQTPTQGGL